jgi:hypothetical protein
LRGLGDRRTTVFGSVSIVRSRLLAYRCRLFVVRLLIVLVAAVLLVHLHGGLVLVAGVNRLGLVGVRSLWRLHHATRRRGSVLALILVLVGTVRRHLRVCGAVWRSHLLVVIRRLIRLRHIIHAWAAWRNQRVTARIRDRTRAIRIEWDVGWLAIIIGS